jgi:hypothetical protein
VTACDAKGEPLATRSALASGYAKIARLGYSYLGPLVVGMDPLDANVAVGDLVTRIQTRVDAGVQGGRNNPQESALKLVQIQPTIDKATWVVRTRGGNAYLVPSSGWPASRSIAEKDRDIFVPGPEYGPFPLNEIGLGKLAENLGKIAKAQNLLRLAPAPDGSNLVAGGVRVELELRKYASLDDTEGKPIDLSQGAPVIESGDLIGFKVTNAGQKDVDITLLFVDAGFGITPWFPRFGETGNRIKSGQTFGPPAITLAQVTAATTGLEHMILLAVEAKGGPVDFTWLAQEGVAAPPAARGDGSLSDLQNLLGFGMSRQGTRGAVPAQAGGTAYVMRSISWNVPQEQKPAN